MSTIAQLGAAINRECDLRLAGRDPAVAMPLFTNAGYNWTPPVDPPVAGVSYLAPNVKCWLQPLRRQLTPVMFESGYWYQGLGFTPLTPHHGVSVSHWGPDVGTVLEFAGPDGQLFKTHITHWINDHMADGNPDLSIYRWADALPDWVFIPPIAHAAMTLSAFASAGQPIPTVALSQGDPDTHYDPTQPHDSGFSYLHTPSAKTWCPDNRKMYVNVNATGTRAGFQHLPTIGDSGAPEYILCNGILYLYGVLQLSDGTSVPIAANLAYLNSMIARSQAAAGDSTVYTVTAAPMPVLNDQPKNFIPYGN